MERIVDRQEIISIIRTVISTRLQELGESADVTENTALFGNDGMLDSLGLTTALLDVEEQLRQRLKLSFVLASDQALSRSKSPFRTVNTLADYICELIESHGSKQ